MPIQNIRPFVQDLNKRVDLKQGGTISNADNNGVVVNVSLYYGQEEAVISGSVAGAVVCPDGSTVALQGSYSGNVVSVAINSDCLEIPGDIGLGIQVTDIATGTKTTVFRCTFTVDICETNNPVDPGSRTALQIADLIAAIDQAVQSIPPEYDELVQEVSDLQSTILVDAKTGSHYIGVYTGLKFGGSDTTVSSGQGVIAVYKIRPYAHIHLTIHYNSSDKVNRNGIGLCNIATPESGTQITRIGTTQAITEDSIIEFDNGNYNYCYVYFGLTNIALNADKYIELVITEKRRLNGFMEAPQPVNYDLSTYTLTIPADSRVSCGEFTYAINNEIVISGFSIGRIYYHRDTGTIDTNSNGGIYLGAVFPASATGTTSLPFLNCSNVTLNGVSMALYADTTLSVSKAPADAQAVGAEISKLLSYKSAGIEIPENTDLNDLVRGQYVILTANVARTLTNCPVDVGCRLVHFSSFAGEYQILYRISDSNAYNQWFMYVRKKTSGSWIPWTKMQLPTYSEYYNKKLSILGDSISTYGGNVSTSSLDDPRYADGTWTYLGNKIRYPQSNLLTDVEKTYWKILMNHTGMIYGVNDSIAGSKCSWNGTTENDSEGANKHAACMTRIEHLGGNGTPDVILVNIGTNDQGGNVDIGPETDTEQLPSWYDYYASPENYTREQIYALPVRTFKDAYRTMLVRIMWMYPSAKVICMTVNFRKNTRLDKTDTYNEAIKEVCDMLGVSVIDTRHSGISVFELSTYYGDSTHYNARGMQLLADIVLKAFMYGV